MFSLQRQDVAARLIEARQTIELIAELENVPPTPDSLTVIGLRGLAIVQLYACLEFAVNQAVQRTLILIQGYNIQQQHLAPRFYTVAMAGHFQAIRDSGKNNKWKNRIKLVDNLFSESTSNINSVLFADELQNTWVGTIQELFDCLGINTSPLPKIAYAGHIDALVEKRNAVAHGRTSPVEIGRGSRSQELKLYWDVVSETTEHIFQVLASYIGNLGFVAPAERTRYQQAPTGNFAQQ